MKPAVRRRPMQVDKTRPYWWWQGASVVELTARLNAAGPDARLEVHIDAEQHATLVVFPPGDQPSTADPIKPPINDSFVCPPRCP
jgi:hypothetical protein